MISVFVCLLVCLYICSPAAYLQNYTSGFFVNVAYGRGWASFSSGVATCCYVLLVSFMSMTSYLLMMGHVEACR